MAGIGNIGNGGDVVVCTFKSQARSYSLDYLLADEKFGRDQEIIRVSNVQESTERLARVIAGKVPALLPSFTAFFQLVQNEDVSKNYVWVGKNNLPDIDDENVGNISGGLCGAPFYAAEVKQAFIRHVIVKKDNSYQIVLTYDRDLFLDLSRSYPTQLSFLLVHEWLWDLNSNVAQNRNINYFLHSKNIEKMKPSAVVEKLNLLGLKIKN